MTTTRPAARCLRPRPVDDPAVRLVGFHHAGGSAAVYYPIARRLPADWDLVLIDLPGRGKGLAYRALTTMEEITDWGVAQLRPWLDAPTAIFGHSLGAVVATEVGRRLEQDGNPLLWVGVSGRIAPGAQADGIAPDPLFELDDENLIRVLVEMGGMPARVAELPEFVDRFLEIVRADLRAVHEYRPEPGRSRLGCPMTVFGGTSDPWAPPAAMTQWADETTVPLRRRFFPGGHFYFLGDRFDGFTDELVAEISAVAAG